MEQILQYLSTYGVPIVIPAYFLFKDFTNSKTTKETLTELKTVIQNNTEMLAIVKNYLEQEDKEYGSK